MNFSEEALSFVKKRYKQKFGTLEDFEESYSLYLKVPTFKACENIHQIATHYTKDRDLSDREGRFIENDSMNPRVHWIMRMFTQYYLTQAFRAMKIDLDDPNISENALGKGTPGRLAKMWLGNDPEDTTELGSGRWNKEPFISRFPSNGGESVISKEVDIVACCSHHFLPFTTFNGGKAIIAYKPGKFVLGISKLQRYVTWCARRFWLQEDLTQYIGETIKRIAETNDVYVKLEGLVHGCEEFRGANTKNGNLTTEYRSGIFNSMEDNKKW